ncbi:TPA: restriction endonuclease subunit S, partial [Escherichia coli]
MSRKFQVKAVPSSWLENNGRRLDCGPYLSGAMEAKEKLRALKVKKEPLESLMQGIFHAGRESRLWVDTKEYGVEFLSSSEIQLADLSFLPLISKKQVAANPNFTIRQNWTLITRSGTIGRMAYAGPNLDGLACSEHVMRVAPDQEKVLPGYIFAYLSSKFGVPLIVSGT